MSGKWKIMTVATAALLISVCLINNTKAYAFSTQDSSKIHGGVFADTVDLSGMTEEEAVQAVTKYVEGLKNTEITLSTVEDNNVVVKAGDLGLTWSNPTICEEAFELGKKGNLVQRYKALKDLEQTQKVFAVELAFDEATIGNVITQQCVPFDKEAIEAGLTKTEDGFEVVAGQTGLKVNVAQSTTAIKDYMDNSWTKAPAGVELVVEVDTPKANADDLSQITDVIGSFTTSFKTSAKARSANVVNGCRLINGTVLYPGETFSAYDTIKPFTEENGYYLAGSYLNGLVVESIGGGICQVSSTLYNAVIRAELEVTERFNHSMIVGYVDKSADAAISEETKDFKFTNNYDIPIFIEGYTTDDKKITFNIYGKETRSADRTISFESEVLEQMDPVGEKVIADPAQPVGYIDIQAPHIGYKAKYWKIVKVNGVETERIQLNSSTYMPSPRTATVGTATADPAAASAIAAAVSTQNVDYCSGIAASILGADGGAAASQAVSVAQALADAAAQAQAAQ